MTKINNFADMKKIITFLFLFSLIFSACETEFEVNANWEEVMVVYGLLDQSQEQQYIKINKAYLGEGNALQMASVADSVNYDPADLHVQIIRVKDGAFGSVIRIDSIDLDTTTLIVKDDGLFATDKNIIYTSSGKISANGLESYDFFDNDEQDFILTILNKKSGKKVSAKTNLIEELSLDIPSIMKMGFYGNIPDPVVLPLDKSQTTIEWRHSKNGRIYQIIARVHYNNYFHNDTTSTYLDWYQPQIIHNGSSEMYYTFFGDAFVNALSNKITNTDSNLVARRLQSIELLFTVGSEDLETYMDLNKPFEGIVQERPFFTNINNGIGLFSCRYNKSHTMLVANNTREGLAIDLDSLDFIFP